MENFYNFDINDFNCLSPLATEASDYCEEVLKDGKKFHLCTFPDCGKIFRFKSEFMRHKVIHVVSRPFVCPFDGCNKTFKREDALKNHLRIHTGEMPFLCEMPDCGMRFPTKAGLRYHLLKHKGEKECVCSFPGCGKSFLTMAQLKQHESASSYHKKVASQAPVENYEPAQMYPKNEKQKDAMLDDFFSPDLKVAGKIEWEMKDQFDDYRNHNVVNNNMQENFEKLVGVILKENSMLKQRLNMCTTLMNLMQENNDLKQKLTPNPMNVNVNVNAMQVEPFRQPNMMENPDDQIFQFLSFYDSGKTN